MYVLNKIYCLLVHDIINDMIYMYIYNISKYSVNENRLKWIKIDSDCQKYGFMNIKMNPFYSWMHFYSFIGIA